MNDIEHQSIFHVRATWDNPDIPAQLLNTFQPKWTVDGRETTDTFDGKLLGFSSSRRRQHNHGGTDTRDEFSSDARRITQRCPACRWSEIRIFAVTDDPRGRYLIHTLGVSVIPGERVLARTQWAQTGFEVIECATVRKGDSAPPFLPAGHARALAMAAGFDDDVADAFVNRAVA